MLQTRIIPCLQLIGGSLVKTTKFDNHQYIGDPINTVRIFNELEVDELCFLDIRASKEYREPSYKILEQIADEAFMPMAYGGGVKTFEEAKKILGIGFEKIIINTSAYNSPDLITKISEYFGSQAVVVSIDVKKSLLGNWNIYIYDGTKKVNTPLINYLSVIEKAGVGEILITSIDKEGTWGGYDIKLIKSVTNNVSVPVIANGGAGSLDDIKKVIHEGGASAAALGSMVVYQKKDMGVLINFPDKIQRESVIKYV